MTVITHNEPVSLRGRSRECALLDDLLSAVRRGESRSLVLRGEAGIGKTALLKYLVDSVPDLSVLRTAGVESEMELAYAGLHQLCAPMLDRLHTLPAPQRQALEIAFGLRTGAAADRFLVGLAVLSLFSEAAQERPLLCVADDAQWLDYTSAVTLAFVGRRLVAESVGLVFAAREPGEERSGLPELVVQGLGDGDARELLASVARWPMDERVREQLLAEARGNPLAILELPRDRSPAQFAGGFGMPQALSLPRRIEESFMQRLHAMPLDTQSLLLVAAAEPLGDPALLWRAAERLGIARPAAEPAETAGLLEIDNRVRFRHPLVRSAVYGAGAPEERRRVHRALAEATDLEAGADRRAWHFAEAAAGPDEHVAAELERAAGRAAARGGLAPAAAFLERAADLTIDPSRRAERALAAAQANSEAGHVKAAFAVLASAEAAAVDDLQRARVDLLRAQITFGSGIVNDASQQLLEAAKRIEPLDAKLARETYLDAWGAALFAGRLAPRGTLEAISRAAQAGPRVVDSPRASDLLLDGFALLVTEGRVAATPKLARGARAFADTAASTEEGLRWAWLAVTAAATLWDYETWRAIHARQVSLAREAGALAFLPIQIHGQVICDVCGGAFGAAHSLLSEANAASEATGARIAPYGALLLAALRGREDEFFELARPAVDEFIALGQGVALQWTNWTTAVLYNGLGRYADAVRLAADASDEEARLFISAWSLPELIEAAARSGEVAVAAEAVERLAAATQPSGTDWALGVEVRSRALISSGGVADALYRESITRLERGRVRVELARAHLLYGEWLRRENRRVDSRLQLRTAHDQFTSIGMEAFAERARRELVATGERLRRRTVETRDDLTPQERQIAELARDGLANPEIGARLFLSPRTVEWHLRKVFGKLGIHRRRELANALSQCDSERRPA
jgi:DNA-binding CsgD family transcriptional regulator